MSAAGSVVTTFANAAELQRRLGNVPLERISMRVPPGRATELDLLRLNALGERLYELVEGTLVEKPMGYSESVLAARISRLLGAFVDEYDLGEVAGSDATMRLLEGLVRLPDVSFVCWDKLPGRLLPVAAVPDLVPDLAIEVLSESNTPEEIERKLGEYFLAGTRLVWVVDPARRVVEVYVSADGPVATLTEKDTLDGGDVLPGFTLSLAKVFARLPGKPKKPRKPRKKEG